MKLENLHFFQNRYRLYLIAHLLITVLVILIFKIISDVKIAATLNGLLFLLGPSWVLIFEARHKKIFRSFSSYGALLFLITSAFPIFFLRIFNWNESFESLKLPEILGGFSGPELHKASTNIFYVMLVTFVFDAIFWARREKNKSDAF